MLRRSVHLGWSGVGGQIEGRAPRPSHCRRLLIVRVAVRFGRGRVSYSPCRQGRRDDPVQVAQVFVGLASSGIVRRTGGYRRRDVKVAVGSR